MANKQLSKGDWIAAGFKALASSGPQSLKAEALARALGTTKGSFYWHFKDVASFHDSMLEQWQSSSAFSNSDSSEQPAARLRKRAQNCAAQSDQSLRAWARSNTRVASALALSDAHNLAELTSLLEQCGVSNPELAQVLYAATISINDTSATAPEEAIGTLVDLILALR